MPDELTKEERLALARLDKEVPAQARLDRVSELALRKSDNERLVSVEKLKANAAADRRERIGYYLAGLAVLVVLLAIIAAIWTSADRGKAKDLQREQLRQQTAQECIRAGNIWTGDGDCLITQRVTR